jgi:hypothetical protein
VGKLLTLGGLGIWWIVDIFLLVTGQFPLPPCYWSVFSSSLLLVSFLFLLVVSSSLLTVSFFSSSLLLVSLFFLLVTGQFPHPPLLLVSFLFLLVAVQFPYPPCY